MFRLIDKEKYAVPCLDAHEPACVSIAAADLVRDLQRVCLGSSLSECTPDMTLRPDNLCGRILIGTATNEYYLDILHNHNIHPHLPCGWEQYSIEITGGDSGYALIIGSDDLGTIYGIYAFSRSFLHTDPMYLWSGISPQKLEQLSIEPQRIQGGPKTFRFRGWFINDEDLLEGFSKAGKPETGYDFHRDFSAPLDRICETALRMGQNLIIPCTYLNIMDLAHEALISVITRRGLYVSMHHQEPVGVHQLVMDRYWKDRGVENLNYLDHKPYYEEIWRQYIRKWSKYDRVIWQLGLRGRGDRPFWYNASCAPESSRERGAIISDAIRRQYEIIQEENPGKKLLTSSTLWMEGMELYKENTLHFPEDTQIIFADFGPNQMLECGYETFRRDSGSRYGIYYHVAFWGCGPHMVSGNFPEKIYYNYSRAVKNGDTAYSVLNVSNIREFVYEIEAVSQITWDFESFEPNLFRDAWCAERFGKDNAAEFATLYWDYYNCFHEMECDALPGQMFLMDGMCRRVALKLMGLIQGGEFQSTDIQNKRLFGFPGKTEFVSYYKTATKAGLERFEAFHSRIMKASESICGESHALFVSNMIVQTEIMIGLYSWVHFLCLTAESIDEDADFARNSLRLAYEALIRIIEQRKKAEQGDFVHWYDGDRLIDLSGCACLTKQLLQTNDGCDGMKFENLM